jgi:hypothetical protein
VNGLRVCARSCSVTGRSRRPRIMICKLYLSSSGTHARAETMFGSLAAIIE